MTIEELNVLFDLRAELEWLNTAKAIVYRYLREETRSTHGAKEGA